MKEERIKRIANGEDKNDIQMERLIKSINIKGEFNNQYEFSDELLSLMEERQKALDQVSKDVYNSYSYQLNELSKIFKEVYEKWHKAYDKLRMERQFIHLKDFGDEQTDYSVLTDLFRNIEGMEEWLKSGEDIDDILKEFIAFNASLDFADGLDNADSISSVLEQWEYVLDLYEYDKESIEKDFLHSKLQEWKELLIKAFGTDEYEQEDAEELYVAIANKIKEILYSRYGISNAI